MMQTNMYAKQIYRLANEDHTLRWLNRTSGALALISIECTPRGGWIDVVLI